jgi:hypothetical protein
MVAPDGGFTLEDVWRAYETGARDVLNSGAWQHTLPYALALICRSADAYVKSVAVPMVFDSNHVTSDGMLRFSIDMTVDVREMAQWLPSDLTNFFRALGDLQTATAYARASRRGPGERP